MYKDIVDIDKSKAKAEDVVGVTQRGVFESSEKDPYVKTFEKKGEKNPELPDFDSFEVKIPKPMCWFCWFEDNKVVPGIYHVDGWHFTCEKHKGMKIPEGTKQTKLDYLDM